MTGALSDALVRVLGADGASFVTLVRVAGLDPGSDFRNCNLDGIDFAGCTLSGFDFSGSVLSNCSFRGSILGSARFDGTVTDPGALEEALDWLTSFARTVPRAKSTSKEEVDPVDSIGASVRRLQTVVGVQGHLRYLADRSALDVMSIIATAATNAPVQETVDGLMAATGERWSMSPASFSNGQHAVSELRSMFLQREQTVETIRRSAEAAPTFGLSFCCVSALTWLYQGLETAQLSHARRLLELESLSSLNPDDWKFISRIKPNSMMFDWQHRALRKALQSDKRRPTEVHIIQLLLMAKSAEQTDRVYKMIAERELTITLGIAKALAKVTLRPPPQPVGDRERLENSDWGNTAIGRLLLKLQKGDPGVERISLTESFEIGRTIRRMIGLT